MTPILTQRVFADIVRAYRTDYGLTPYLVQPDGHLLRQQTDAPENLGVLTDCRREALQEAMRWGEPNVFFLAPGVISWIVPVVDGDRLLGGVSGGEMLEAEDGDVDGAVNHLVQAGCPFAAAARYIQKRPIWRLGDTWSTASRLFSLVYACSGLTPTQLDRNRESARQQRGIAETIHLSKNKPHPGPSIQEERTLLAMLRIGDQTGTRRALNDMLAAIFLRSPRLAVVKARMIELLGYLIRAAIEDNPAMEPLFERHLAWLEKLIAADDFETLCDVVRQALDDFMREFERPEFKRLDHRVRLALDYIAGHYSDPVTLGEVARAAQSSPFHIAHLIKRVTGRTVLQHVHAHRIEQARLMLQQNRLDCLEIAMKLGYADQSHFTRLFRRHMGMTPAKYRRQFFRGA